MNTLAHTRQIRIGAITALCLALPFAALADETTFDRTLSVTGPVTLNVNTSSGHIHVSRGPDDQVHIVGHVTASGKQSSAASSVAGVVAEPPIQQNGNVIGVGSESAIRTPGKVAIDYEITLPHNCQLSAKSGNGEIKLSGLDSAVKAETVTGNIYAEKLGAGSSLLTGTGLIDASDLAGGSTLQTGSGNIHARFSAPGDVSAGTGSGAIQLENVQGNVKADAGAGNLDISGKPSSPWELRTGMGSISVGVGTVPFTLDAQTGAGSIKSDIPVDLQASSNKHHLMGTVHGGGSTLKVDTISGNIRIHS